MARRKIEWKLAILISGVSAIISLILFILTEIIWGDVLKDLLRSGYETNYYSTINFILILGLLIIFGVSFLTNIIIYRKFTKASKIIANSLTFVITLIILFFIAWISVIVLFADQYQNISILQKFSMIFIYFAYFGVYVLPNPVWFWILGLIIYHIVLIVFIRLFFIKKHNIRAYRKSSQFKGVYSNKKSII